LQCNEFRAVALLRGAARAGPDDLGDDALEVVLNHELFDDLDQIELLAQEIIPKVAT